MLPRTQPYGIDPLLKLAFGLHSAKGVYALLLGSGVSRSAGIPTGWDVTLDLAEQVASLRQEETHGDVEAWFRSSFGKEPSYSDLLEELAPTQAERSRILQHYFDPTDEERQAGRKMPQPAHQAIAQIAAAGCIKLILTTNFDSLVEQALDAEGVAHTVVSTTDALAGVLPLQHSGCLVVKLHGDYRDVRIRNTGTELNEYDPLLDAFLDRVLDEYGLVVCGWSAEWDGALRSSIERCKSRRFSTYWAHIAELQATGSKLVQLRAAEPILIEGADRFFKLVAEKVASLEELARPHPLTIATGVATLKTLLSEGRHRIRLHDLLEDEIAQLGERMREILPNWYATPDPAEHADLIHRIESASDMLCHLVAVGCYWSNEEQDDLWPRVLTKVAAALYVENRPSYRSLFGDLAHYPALRLLFAGGVAATAASKFRTLRLLLNSATVLNDRGEAEPAVTALTTSLLSGPVVDVLRPPPEGRRFLIPVSEYLLESLSTAAAAAALTQSEYKTAFENFEMLASLVQMELRLSAGMGAGAPLGTHVHALQRERDGRPSFLTAGVAAGQAWKPLADGMFDGSAAHFQQLAEQFRLAIRSGAEARGWYW